MSEELELLKARVAILERQMLNVNREFELGPVSQFWEQSNLGSNPTPESTEE